MKEKIGISVYRMYKAKGRFESPVGQNWIALNIVCKSGSETERSTFWSVSAHQHQIEGLQKAFLNALLQPCPELGSRTRNTKLYHFKDRNCTLHLWSWSYSQTWDGTVHLRTAAGHLPRTSVSDDCRRVKVPSTGHGNYERTEDLGCIKGYQQGPLFPKLILQALEREQLGAEMPTQFRLFKQTTAEMDRNVHVLAQHKQQHRNTCVQTPFTPQHI